MRRITLADGRSVPALGLGTWRMGEDRQARAAEVAALRAGIEAGATLVDTAEMYADGGAEEVVGEAIRGRRDEVFIVSKVLPSNATRRGVARACEGSLRRLGTDRLDLYLLHWVGDVPFEETLRGFEDLVQAGKILGFGVSNLDLASLETWLALPGGARTLVDQVMYHVGERGIEHDLLPFCAGQGIAVMAYCPLAQGSLPRERALREVAARHGRTPAQVMLAWTLRQPNVIAIPKSARPERVRENVAAVDLALSSEDLALLDRAFPPPRGPQPLATT